MTPPPTESNPLSFREKLKAALSWAVLIGGGLGVYYLINRGPGDRDEGKIRHDPSAEVESALPPAPSPSTPPRKKPVGHSIDAGSADAEAPPEASAAFMY